jgi:hypothetical protein
MGFHVLLHWPWFSLFLTILVVGRACVEIGTCGVEAVGWSGVEWELVCTYTGLFTECVFVVLMFRFVPRPAD